MTLDQLVLMSKDNSCQRVLSGSVVPELPEDLLGMKILGPYLRSKESKPLEVKSINLYFKTFLGKQTVEKLLKGSVILVYSSPDKMEKNTF